MIARNVLANVLGGSWSIILTLLLIPIQLRYLGAEAFGLLAFIASLEVLFNVFDLGLTPTIAREVAIDTSPDLQNSRDLLQTLSVVYVTIGLVLGGAVFVGADWLVEHWLKLDGLSADSARLALQLGGVATAIRWPVSFFTGVVTGLGRFDILNLLKAGSATFRLLGGATVIVAFADLVAFVAWLVLAAFLEVAAYLWACLRLVPGLSFQPRVSRPSLARVWHFAVSMSVVRVLNIGISQSDHLMLSVLAPIETLGYYALAYRVLSGLTLLHGFVTTALFPSFAADYVRGAMAKLVLDYNRATQSLIFFSVLPTAALLFFGEEILRVWTTAEAAAQAGPILRLLAPGFLLNVSVAIATTLAVATAHVEFVIWRSAVGLALYIPVLYVAITYWGAVGAAGAWILINISFLVTLLPLVQSRIVNQSTATWYAHNLIPFLVAGMLSFGLSRLALMAAGWDGPVAVAGACTVAAVVYGGWGLRLLYPDVRRQLLTLSRKQLTRASRGAS